MAVENQDENINKEINAEENVNTLQVENENDTPKNIVASEAEEDFSEDVVVTIGEDSPPEIEEETKAPEWVKELRKNNREIQRENRELREQLNTIKPTETKPVALGKKPTLDECDYDSEEYESKLSRWYDDKRAYDDEQLKKKSSADEATKAWQSTLEGYGKAKNELKVKDFDDAEEIVLTTLSIDQQGMILQGADNAALVVYALGKNPSKAKELASIKDPVKFAFAVAKLETTLKVTNRRIPPAPESKISGNAKLSGTVDSTLERLRAEASKTGDFTKVINYKKSKAS